MQQLLVTLAVVGLAAACGNQGGEAGAEFLVSGRIVDVRPGAETDVDVLEGDTDTDARTGGNPGQDEGEPPDPGAIVVRVDDEAPSELAACETDDGGFTIYYTQDTRFDPTDIVDGDEFPDGLRGQDVDVAGTVHTEEGEQQACTIVAARVTLSDEGDTPGARSTFTPGPRPQRPGATDAVDTDPDGSPGTGTGGAGQTGEPVETSEATPGG